MITDLIIHAGISLLRVVLDALPTWTLPSVFSDLHSRAVSVGTTAGGLSAWIPWGTVTTVMTACVAVWGLAIGARLTLWLWSKVPGVGK